MKKLFYPFAFALTAFLILYSCSAEEEDTTPPPTVQQPTPEPEPETQAAATNTYYVSVNYGEEIEGGNLSIVGDEYEEGTNLSIVATPDDGYYFYAWESNTVVDIDDNGNDIWGKHSTWGSFEDEIQIIVNSKFNLVPIFLEKTEINQNTSWDFQGFNTTGFSGLGSELLFENLDIVPIRNLNRALNKIIENGGNSILLDYHVQHTGGKNANEISIENTNQFNQIIPVAKMAEKLGLSLTLKTVLLTESHINPDVEPYDWSEIVPSSPSTFFQNYLSALEETALLINENNLNIDKWALTNELVSLTTNELYAQEWISLINRIKSLTDIKLGFNVRATNTPYIASRSCSDNYVQEYTQVPNQVYDALDFIGLSIYKANFWNLAKTEQSVLSEQFYKESWTNGPYIELNFDNNTCGDCVYDDCRYSYGINYVNDINNFISSKNKDIYISEFGAVPYKNLSSPNWSDSSLNVEMDLELQKEYFMATLDVFKNSIIGLKGVYGYMFPLQEKVLTEEEINAQSQYNWFNQNFWTLGRMVSGNEYEWNINDKPALEAFRQYYISE